MTQPHIVNVIKCAAAKLRQAYISVILSDAGASMCFAYFIITTERSSKKLLESQENSKIKLPTILAMPPILKHSHLVHPYHLSFTSVYQLHRNYYVF